jgi:hypothetical protein
MSNVMFINMLRAWRSADVDEKDAWLTASMVKMYPTMPSQNN